MPIIEGNLASYRTIDGQPAGVVVKASPGLLAGWYLFNNAASLNYVKIYDKATAPTSSDTPKLTLTVPNGQGANAFPVAGIEFQSGIGIRVTTGIADNNTGAPAANDVTVNLFFR